MKKMNNIPENLESANELRKAFLDFTSIYAKLLVTYTCGAFFALFGLILFIQKSPPIPTQEAIIFWIVIAFLVLVSYLIRRYEITRGLNVFVLLIWVGNACGLLFNFIYAFLKFGSIYGAPNYFGSIGDFVTRADKAGFSLIENMYGFIGGMLFVLTMALSTTYGLSLRDKFKKTGRRHMATFAIFIAVLSGLTFITLFGIALTYNTNLFMYFTATITGSMIYTYTKNLFVKESSLLKFKVLSNLNS